VIFIETDRVEQVDHATIELPRIHVLIQSDRFGDDILDQHSRIEAKRSGLETPSAALCECRAVSSQMLFIVAISTRSAAFIMLDDDKRCCRWLGRAERTIALPVVVFPTA
jgi:hypothetical protein